MNEDLMFRITSDQYSIGPTRFRKKYSEMPLYIARFQLIERRNLVNVEHININHMELENMFFFL